MAFGRRSSSAGPATEALRETVRSLPDRVADWTPEQRQQHNEISDAACREQNGQSPE
ncbi:hypothetical protein [Streptomyces altiplanensis]